MDYFKSKIKEGHLFITFSSSLAHIDMAVGEINDFLFKNKANVDLDQDDLIFDANLILREALTNAVEHGNCFDVFKKVSIEVNSTFTYLRVEDEGDGFDWKCFDMDRSPDTAKPSGRGLHIMNIYGFIVTYNTKGNVLTLKKRENAIS